MKEVIICIHFRSVNAVPVATIKCNHTYKCYNNYEM